MNLTPGAMPRSSRGVAGPDHLGRRWMLRRFACMPTGRCRVMRTWCFMVSHVTMMVPSALVSEGQYSTFTVALNRLKPDVQKIAFTVTCDGGQTVSGLRNLSIDVEQGATGTVSGSVELSGRQEAALILGEFYRRNNDWKFRFVAQGSTVDLNRWQSISA